MSPLIIAMAVFVQGRRLRAVERPPAVNRGTGDGIGGAGFLYLVGMAALVAIRHFS